MIDVQAFAQAAGGIGLCLLGLMLATEGVQIAGGGMFERFVAAAQRARGAGFRVGLALGVAVPRSSARARATLGLVGGNFMHLGPTLRAGLGAGVGLPVLALFVVWATRTTGAAGAAALLVAAGVAALRHGAGRVALGAGLVALGAQAAEAGFAQSGVHLDALSLGFSARLLLLFAAGVAGAGLRGAGVVLVLGLTAAAGGALELSSAAALLAGVHGGAGLATLPALWRSRGDGARAALGLAVMHLVGGALGMVLVRVSLPWSTAPAVDRFPPVALLALFQLVLWGTWCVAWLPLLGLLRGALEERVEPREGTHALDTGVPALAVADVEARLERAAALVELGARRQLAGDGATDFRLARAQEEAARLATEVEALLPGLAGRALPPDLARRLRGATRRARVSEELLALLVELRGHAEAQDHLLGGLLPRLRQIQAGTLHLLEGSRGGPPAEVEQERATVAQHLAHMRQNVLLEAVKQRIHPRLAQDFGERLDLLARAGRLAVERSALLDAASARVMPRSAPESQAAPAFAV